MTEKDEIKLKLDCIGLFCPEPLFQTREKIDELDIGDVVEVLADDPAAEEDLKRLVKRTGQELLKFEEDNGTFRFLIKRIK